MSETTVETFDLGDFELDSGTTLPGARIVYTTYGTLNDTRDNVIVWPSWFTGSHAEHEWMIGDGDALDTSEYFVVVPSMFANGLSSSPSNTPPPFDGPHFPRHTIQDNVRAQHRLLSERFDVTRIQLVIGGSMGAFQAFEWALGHADLVERIMPCCGASRVSRHCYVFLAGIKAGVLADSSFAEGDYSAPPEAGLRAAGRIYAGWGLSQAFYREELYRQLGFDSVDAFLEGFWEAWWLSVDANDALSQIDTWQVANVAARPGYDGDIERALGDIRAKAFLCPGETDLYFPPEDMAWEAERMPNAELRVLPGPWGHQSDAGLDQNCMDTLRGHARELLAS